MVVTMHQARRLVWSCLLLTLLSLSFDLIVGAPPVPSSISAAARQTLEKRIEIDSQHEHEYPELPGAIHAGSLHSATLSRLEQHQQQQQSSHRIDPKNQAKVDAFVAQLDHLVAGLKAKSQIATLNKKYPGARTEKENATLAHVESELHALEEEDDFARSAEESPAVHGIFGSQRRGRAPSRASRAHIPQHEPARPTHDPSHILLDPLPSRIRRRRRRTHANEDTYVLHPIQLAPVSPSPSGLNFTTFIYPTIQGNVTIFVGVTEWPLGKFHFYPSPREEMDEISLIQAKETYAAQQAKARSSPNRTPIMTSFLELSAQLNPLCDGVALTSVSARAYNCLLAQNAGFFNMATDGCMGNVVSNDQFINHATPDLVSHSHFGLTRKGNFITGYLSEDEVTNGVDGGFHELIQGSGWLVREGMNFINQSATKENIGQHFVTEKAPRNALGHDSEGRLLMFEADGEEDINLGLTLLEFADILTHHFNVVNAINVDGGGSSTTVYKGDVADKPTCRDTPQVCERAVTTISCVMP